ncbi:PREDICTED: transcriptional regulator ATRX-like [Acropora digitifera]|uniref:transcriptional regulator ATRX-like n=1 Tax=Acropora digitifera TaxID=70779 RepID=UPI00077AA843|nr:PREDICTED: transcriptional regulator ATRX-like [Acropora digitifera]
MLKVSHEELSPETQSRNVAKEGEEDNIRDKEENLTCNGETDNNNVNNEQDCSSMLVKTEPLDNLVEGDQKRLENKINEEVAQEIGEGSEKTKRLYSEGSEADGAELPRKIECTACGRRVNPAHGTICWHPCLNVLVCKKCNQYYNSGPFTRDEFGIDEQCRWCGDGGSLLCCDKCDKAFCKPCIKRNFGKGFLKEIVNAPEAVEWLCYCCNPKPLSKLVKECRRIMNILQTRKSQKTIFKTKKGPFLPGTPNQKERRNRLGSLSENLEKNCDSALSPVHGASSDEEGSDSAKDHKISLNKKEVARNRKQNLSSKVIVNIVDESDSGDTMKGIKDSREKPLKAYCSTKKNVEIVSEDSEIESTKKESKRNKKVKSELDRGSAEDSSAGQEKSKNKKGRKRRLEAKTLKGGQTSESDSNLSDFITMVKGNNKLTKKRSKQPHKDKGKNKVTSDSKSKRTRRAKKSSVSEKQTRKRPRKVTSSENESDESGSDEAMPVRKGKQANKRRKRGKLALESDDDNNKALGWQKKRQSMRKAKKSSSESEEDKKKGRKKGKNSRRGKSSGKKIRGKKHYIEKDSGESEDVEEEEEEEEESPSKHKGRKKIRKLIKDDKLTDETKRARKLEEERRKRLLERTRNNEDDMPSESARVSKLVLESDQTSKEIIAEVNEDLVQHLKPHQCKGIQFMYDCLIESVNSWKKDEPGGGCILAHCMGLGKTLQVIALVHTLMTNKEINLQRVLVVCPLNTVLNWQVEFDKWLSVDDRLEVFVLQDVSGDNWRRADMLNHWLKYGGVMILGYSLYRNLSQCLRVRSKNQKKIFKEALVDPGPHLVICDEGHILRNDATAISKALNAIKTRRRIVLTGTPLQNNLIEYHCMVSFVKPSLLGTRKEYTNTFANPIQNGQCADSTSLDVQLMKQRCHVLHKMLEGCVQVSKRKGLWFVFEIVVRRFFFLLFSFGGVSLFSDYQALMRIWTHPWCLKLEAMRRPEKFVDSDSMDDFVVHTDEEDEEEEEEEEWHSSSSSEEEAPVTSESEEDRRKQRRRRGRDSSSDEDDDDDESDDESEDEDVPQSPGKSSSQASRPTVNIDGEEITVVDITSRAGTSARKHRDKRPHSSKTDTKEEKEKDVEVEEEKEWYDEFVTDADEFNVELSGKLVLLMEILADAEAVQDKVLVFSQSLVTLDLIEKMLGGGEIGGDRENWCRGCDYFRMDGSTSAAMRQRWADIFNDEDNKNARLFLISTKAGGLGINLVAANRVIVFDVSWNPSHDVQSIFRVYRFGQSKAVFVYRFIAQGTMEEKIYDRQVTKLAIAGRVVDEQQIERHFNSADLTELYSFNADVLEEDKEPDTGKDKESAVEIVTENASEGRKETNAEKEGDQEVQNAVEKGATEKGDSSEVDAGTSHQTETPVKAQEVPKLPLPKDAVLADLINRLHPKWIVNYHEHDSLLQDIESEKLTEEEMKAAWEAYEAEKSGKLATYVPDTLLSDDVQTQQHAAERIRLNSEMLQQIQQIRELQEIQRRQEMEDRMRLVRQEREQVYQRQREALLQEHRRQQDEIRRQNQIRFIQHMTRPGTTPQLQLGQNTINVQTQLPSNAPPRHAPPPSYLTFQTPSTLPLRFHVPSGVASSLSATQPTSRDSIQR